MVLMVSMVSTVSLQVFLFAVATLQTPLCVCLCVCMSMCVCVRCLSVCTKFPPKVSTKPLLRLGWRQVDVHYDSCTCLHLQYRVVQLGPNTFS
jgi:hypothetical protein